MIKPKEITLSSIAAMASNRIIGRQGHLPWSLPEDLKYFRDKTRNHIIVMGRVTWESFEGHLLPQRLHVVLSQSGGASAAMTTSASEGTASVDPKNPVFLPSIEEVLKFCKKESINWNPEVFVIGGSQIYRQFFPLIDKLYLTEILHDYEGDAHFPEFDLSEFTETERRPSRGFDKSINREIGYDFVCYSRKPHKS